MPVRSTSQEALYHQQKYKREMNLANDCWAEAPIKIARMTLTIKLDGNWSSFQLANNTPPLSVTGSVIAPSARMARTDSGGHITYTRAPRPLVTHTVALNFFKRFDF